MKNSTWIGTWKIVCENQTEEIMENYIGYEVYECPKNPTEHGKYIGKTPIYEQALNACKDAKEHGKNYFIKGIKPDGTKVLLI